MSYQKRLKGYYNRLQSLTTSEVREVRETRREWVETLRLKQSNPMQKLTARGKQKKARKVRV